MEQVDLFFPSQNFVLLVSLLWLFINLILLFFFLGFINAPSTAAETPTAVWI